MSARELVSDKESVATYNCCLVCGFRLDGRVKKRAMTSFERDRTMSKMSAQLDYKVCQLNFKKLII